MKPRNRLQLPGERDRSERHDSLVSAIVLTLLLGYLLVIAAYGWAS